jgi:hypothetical protein
MQNNQGLEFLDKFHRFVFNDKQYLSVFFLVAKI